MFSFAHSIPDELVSKGVLGKRVKSMPVARLTVEMICGIEILPDSSRPWSPVRFQPTNIREETVSRFNRESCANCKDNGFLRVSIRQSLIR